MKKVALSVALSVVQRFLTSVAVRNGNQIKQYFSNILEFVKGFGLLGKIEYKEGWNWYKFLPVYIFNVGSSVLLGGAPWETWSSRFHKDRHALIPGLIMAIVEAVHENHGERTVNYYVGELSDKNKELNNFYQLVLLFVYGWLIFGIIL